MDPLSFAESATRSLLSKLGSILVEEAGLLAGVENDVQYIMDELESMTFFLRALSEKQDQNLQVKIWMKQVRELAYDAEDTIDEFTHCLRRLHGERGLLSHLSHTVRQLRVLKVRHRVASDLKNLRLRAHDVSERRARYDLTSIAASSGGAPNYSSNSMPNSSIQARPSPPSLDEVKPVGVDDRRDEIVRWLLEDNQPELRVISIVGFGGLGKTTLATMVFNWVAQQSPAPFQARGWIAVSQSFKLKALLQNMAPHLFTDEDIRVTFKLDRKKKLEREQLEREMKKHMDGMEAIELMTMIRNNLNDKRYVIVLDDIWSITAWRSIKEAFPNNRKCSRIIVTTRDVQVANTCSSSNRQFIYSIPPLGHEHSWKLFRKRVFDAPDYTCPDFLINVSENILKKCGGLPLAIVAIAGVLASKPSKTEADWQKFLDRMSSELESNPSLEGIRQILTLSYNNLPYYLKPCLLSLSTFPEDYEISQTRLATRWIAEGLVIARRDISDKEVAEGYFYELINRNLIMPSEIDSKGKVETCRVHDIMLELIVSQSMDENFITVLDDHTKSIPANGKIRRISFHQISSNLPHDLNLSQARSLTVLTDEMRRLDYGKMRLLRVLDMEGCKGLTESHLMNISKLFLLRFLSLRNTSVTVLPPSIGNLQNLQFLDIREVYEVKIPNSIVKLQRLAYFLFDITWKLPEGIGKMKALQVLGRIDADESCSRELQDIGKLTQLEHLKVDFGGVDRRSWFRQHLGKRCWQNSSIERKSLQICTSLGKLHRCLRYLELLDPNGALLDDLSKLSPPPLHLEEIHLHGPIRCLPSWFESLDHIAMISLFNWANSFEHDITKVLKNLPTLVHLVVLSTDEKWYFDSQGFKCLQKLETHNVKEVIFEEGSLPKLEFLMLSEATSISGVEHLTELNEIWLVGIASGEVAKLDRIAKSLPNHPKVVVG